MNDVDLKSEIRAYMGSKLSDINHDSSEMDIGEINMGEMVRFVVSRESGLLRPQIAIRSAEVYGVPRNHIMPAAVGLELVHGATLVLDDAPFMDDSDIRNGRPSFHKEYGAANATLVAEYLTSSLAPALNAGNENLSAEKRVAIQVECARAASGLCAGQNRDLYHPPENLEEVVGLHRRKTGDLFAAAAVIGGVAGDALEKEIEILRSFGHNLGIAYQMGDDLYDRIGDPRKGGKPVGQDGDKVTALSFLDVSEAVELWKDFYERAEADLLELSSNLHVREKAGEFMGKMDAQPLRCVLKNIRSRQEDMLGGAAA